MAAEPSSVTSLVAAADDDDDDDDDVDKCEMGSTRRSRSSAEFNACMRLRSRSFAFSRRTCRNLRSVAGVMATVPRDLRQRGAAASMTSSSPVNPDDENNNRTSAELSLVHTERVNTSNQTNKESEERSHRKRRVASHRVKIKFVCGSVDARINATRRVQCEWGLRLPST